MPRTRWKYAIETVEEALLRNGMGCVLVLAMSTPLALALTRSFQTMLSLKLENIDRNEADPLQGEHLLGAIGFSGKVVGRVFLRMSSIPPGPSPPEFWASAPKN